MSGNTPHQEQPVQRVQDLFMGQVSRHARQQALSRVLVDDIQDTLIARSCWHKPGPTEMSGP
jgi:hypothetical protein